MLCSIMLFFFFNDTATTEIYTLSLHDALPICKHEGQRRGDPAGTGRAGVGRAARPRDPGAHDPGLRAAGDRRGERVRDDRDRKSTRLNSSHANISYAVFCLKKKKTTKHTPSPQ